MSAPEAALRQGAIAQACICLAHLLLAEREDPTRINRHLLEIGNEIVPFGRIVEVVSDGGIVASSDVDPMARLFAFGGKNRVLRFDISHLLHEEPESIIRSAVQRVARYSQLCEDVVMFRAAVEASGACPSVRSDTARRIFALIAATSCHPATAADALDRALLVGDVSACRWN
jgi:hypothetical protein